MSNVVANAKEYDAIANVFQPYIEGAKSGNGDSMKPAFHPDATIFGYVGADLFAGPIQQLFEWTDANDASPDLEFQIVSISLTDTAATARIELDRWIGFRFTDLFTLLKVDGEWKIMNKVFHLHPDTAAQQASVANN